jgi:hypothetical protein
MTQSPHDKPRRLKLPAIGSLVVALATFGLPAAGWADNQADNLEFIIVSDDIRKQVTNVERPSGSETSPAAPSGSGDDGATTGNTNNGHGNNADGVDSSNPGQGGGGPTGAVDPSGDVDDEAGGGGALPSKGKGKKK